MAALRLTFSYEGDKITLVSQQRVEMMLPPSHPLEVAEGQTGFWYTVEDAQQRAIYRRVMQNPIRHDVEVFSEDPATSVSRLAVSQPKGTFVILVPEVEGPQSVTFFSPPLQPRMAHLSAAPVVRFEIRKEDLR